MKTCAGTAMVTGTRFRLSWVTAILVVGCLGRAEIRPQFDDGEVIDRSDLIVVGRLRKDSIRYVPHERRRDEGASWEHHAVLVIAEVLKGAIQQKEIPITIHYGLTPVVGGRAKGINLRGLRKDYPDDLIEILDTGNSVESDRPLVEDAGKDNLWFLQRRSGRFGETRTEGNYGIRDPEELRPLAWKEYVLAYLAKDPEKAVRERVELYAAIAERGQRYLDHLAIQRVLKIEYAEARIAKLIPYFAKPASGARRMVTHDDAHWGRREARDALIACGTAAGPPLLKLFINPGYHWLRQDILHVWTQTRYEGCVDALVELLKQQDAFWARQKLEEDWWTRSVEFGLLNWRREAHVELLMAVHLLAVVGDARAKEAIELTQRRWEGGQWGGNVVVESCKKALEAISKR